MPIRIHLVAGPGGWLLDFFDVSEPIALTIASFLELSEVRWIFCSVHCWLEIRQRSFRWQGCGYGVHFRRYFWNGSGPLRGPFLFLPSREDSGDEDDIPAKHKSDLD